MKWMKTKLKIFLCLTLLGAAVATAETWQSQVLYSFVATNGIYRQAKLTQGPDGNFYGTP
jgi:hypothetical protein